MRAQPNAPFLDLEADSYNSNPLAAIASARAGGELVQSSRGHEVLAYELGQAIVRDRRLKSDHMSLVGEFDFPEGQALDFKARMLLSVQGPQHIKLRQPLAPIFGAKQAGELRVAIQEIVDRVLREIREDEPVEFFQTVCNRIPAELYCHLVQAPPSDVPFVMRMSDQVLQIFGHNVAARDDILAGYDELIPYVKERIAERSQNLGDDVLSQLIRAQKDGKLTEDELVDQGVMLLEASTDNTAHQMAFVVATLLEWPREWERLRNDPTLISAAIDEAIRLKPRTLAVDRYATEDIDFADQVIRRGERIVVNVQAAQRDPKVFTDPDDFQMNRASSGPLTFGGGAYMCLGRNVALLEIEVLLGTLLERYPKIRLGGPTRTRQNSYVAEVVELPVILR